MALVKQATDDDAIERVFSDLPRLSESTTRTGNLHPLKPPVGALALHRGDAVARPLDRVVCVMANVVRKYAIQPGTVVKAASVMGYCTIELTSGSMEPGEMLLECVAVMGGLEIRIPANVRVEIVGGGLFGSFEQEGTFAPSSEHDRTLVRVQGGAVMGLVVVKAIDIPRP
jgi:hypothetical protein